MASCTACGTTLKAASKFCSSCGTAVPEPRAEPGGAAVKVDKDPVDPLGSTAPASLSPLRKPRPSDPTGGTLVSAKGDEVAAPATKATAGRRGMTAPLSSVEKPGPQPALGRVPGARVLVQWANGQKYPGVLEQLVGVQCLVRFETGERRWIETKYVAPA